MLSGCKDTLFITIKSFVRDRDFYEVIVETLRFIGRQRDGNGKKTLSDMCLKRTQVVYYQSY